MMHFSRRTTSDASTAAGGIRCPAHTESAQNRPVWEENDEPRFKCWLQGCAAFTLSSQRLERESARRVRHWDRNLHSGWIRKRRELL